jgi:hypothetical protein
MSTSHHLMVLNSNLLPALYRFGCRYDAFPEGRKENDIMFLAKRKLLDGRVELTDVNGPGSLACLSVRFALEFDSADGDFRTVACKQIEHHMRLCVAATTGFETLVTIAASEPLLAEAACHLMAGTRANPVRHLASNSDLNCVDCGQRGELVAALLIMRARDVSSFAKRWMYVTEFMKALLPTLAYEMLKSTLPPHWRSGESNSFEETFKGYCMWFNHVIRIKDCDVINIRFLWKFITRGAMIVCANNQRGIDIVLPICDRSKSLSRHNVTAVLIQVKNDKAFQHRIENTAFNLMDPFDIGLVSDGDIPLPIIRMVFALASEKPGVFFPPSRGPGEFTAFDVWCAGLSSETFKGIGDDLTSYHALLQRTIQYHDVYDLKETKDRGMDTGTRNARASLRRRMEPLGDEGDAHNSCHIPQEVDHS